MKKVEPVAYPIQTDSEQLVQSLSNFEEDSSKIAETILVTERILKLKSYVREELGGPILNDYIKYFEDYDLDVLHTLFKYIYMIIDNQGK